MVKGARQESTDFGFDPRSSPYHFAVVVERDGATVRIEERFAVAGNDPDPDSVSSRHPLIKANLDSYRWSRVAEAVRADFNQRIAADGSPGAKWRLHETLLAPYLGKELTLLFWVIEDADPTLVPNMIANWTGLAPEERWWLYTTVNATAGHPQHGRERGWRKAVRIALAENPGASTTPGGWLTRIDADKPEAPTGRRRAHRRPASASGDQLLLLPDETLVQPATADIPASQGKATSR